MAEREIRVSPVPQPIDGALYAEVISPCPSCDGANRVLVRDSDLAQLERHLPFDYPCPRCRGETL